MSIGLDGSVTTDSCGREAVMMGGFERGEGRVKAESDEREKRCLDLISARVLGLDRLSISIDEPS